MFLCFSPVKLTLTLTLFRPVDMSSLSFLVLGLFCESFLFYFTVERQWREHRWLVYHGYFEFVLESPENMHDICRHYCILVNFGGFSIFILIMVCCVYH